MIEKKVKKAIVFLALILCAFTFLSTPASASKKDQKVYDNASLLTKSEVSNLEELCSKYGKKGKLDLVIVTINDPNVTNCDSVLEDLYDNIGFGYEKEKGTTAMIIVDMYSRQVSIQGYGNAETYLNSKRADIIRNKITPNLTDGEYYKAFQSFIKLSTKYMKINPNISPNNVIFQLWFQIMTPIALGIIVVSLMAYQSGGRVTVSNNTYMDHHSAHFHVKSDNYIRSNFTRVPKPKQSDNNNNGGGGGASSGGSSHSTSRGSF